MEEIILNIITYSGEARSSAMEAIQCAKNGDFDKARELIEDANKQLGFAHKQQTTLIQEEARGEKKEVSLLLIHAQDHLMTTMTLKDIANELIEVYTRL
ncbi:PTS system cellobiose-specific IIA component [Clostridium tetanomorphum]|uniref:PTS lactose/cellobiose transporter subunit IIA n=1 Tax=Clostridium tetanomorphum TaxID=1553 RepID=A0A923EA60_CLOTT|nr:PTS lactose/cellobiose transporter subunit IIA [Clostridium tetanomorphum]KAJ51296.1 PTS system cellobiose-specific transporter subunit IIA [Clostridium tetanomorphum DSM 665]MBC2397546.1 PTS lactose/cellobiose transporter subunit IIA [Clostridium tetanomorphum]MBP1863643.1 PTS system cellobiose-specific IIA component [Clostridium tetanomorphum]NRS86219.1 PTS system cellobiose-specific IIA component [Clostridium tetanomorphum]NRZ95702.1 PTS system cellobiose-specific IIA component [Clostrid